MRLLLDKLGISVEHLKCLDEAFREHNQEYQRIENLLTSEEFREIYSDIAREIYAGGKKPRGNTQMARQMILGDVIEYIFSGRAYYYAAKTENNFRNFIKLILYCVNQILLFDTITVNPDIRRAYIEKLEERIPLDQLYEKQGDQETAERLKDSDAVIWTDEWSTEIDLFVDSILPKTLGCPKELIVFAELIRLKKGIVIPLLLIQRTFGDKNPIAPPDFLLLKANKEIYGIEVGYAKEGQSREFSIRTSIPTFAIDLKNNMHNRCPKCGENILYCDPVIEAYSNGTLIDETRNRGGKFYCGNCPNFNNGHCQFSNYYGTVVANRFNGEQCPTQNRHYHANCVLEDHYTYYREERIIGEHHLEDFFAQIPEIDGIDNIITN